jgi:hypothetical protein
VADLLAKTMPDQKGHCDSLEYRAFYQLVKVCLFEESGSLEWAAEEAEAAIRSLRTCGHRLHEALARRALAVIYRKQGLETLAIAELGLSVRLLRTCADAHGIEHDYQKRSMCEEQILRCLEQAKDIEAAMQQAAGRPAAKPRKTGRAGRRSAQMIYGVFDMVHAGLKGVFVMDDAEIGEMSIEQVLFDGKKHQIFNLREGRQIKMNPSGRYAWLRVAGDSMNACKPVPIEPSDYVLVDFTIVPQQGNLVFASLNDAPTPKERAGVIKRLAADGLRSESSENYGPIPLEKVTLKAVVLAVAKPEQEPELPEGE